MYFQYPRYNLVCIKELKMIFIQPWSKTCVLGHFSKILQSSSDKSVGAELSLTLTPEQQKYCTTRKELLAIIRFSRQFRHYLLGRHFTVRTYHNSLTWLMNFKEPQGQLARWLEELMSVQYGNPASAWEETYECRCLIKDR